MVSCVSLGTGRRTDIYLWSVVNGNFYLICAWLKMDFNGGMLLTHIEVEQIVIVKRLLVCSQLLSAVCKVQCT